MKFFTMAWWGGIQPDAEQEYDGVDPYQAYGSYITTIQDQIPPSILVFLSNVTLHDAKLRTLSYMQSSATLTIGFDNFHAESMKPQRFYLQYLDVTSFQSIADPNTGLGGPHGYGDLGYDEIDITADGQFEHRLLFSSGIEMDITCRDARSWWSANDED